MASGGSIRCLLHCADLWCLLALLFKVLVDIIFSTGPDNGHFNVGLAINPIESLRFVMLTENSLNAIDV